MLDLSPGFSIRVDDETEELVIEGVDYDPMSTEWNPNVRVIGRVAFSSLSLISLRPEPLPEGSGDVETEPELVPDPGPNPLA